MRESGATLNDLQEFFGACEKQHSICLKIFPFSERNDSEKLIMMTPVLIEFVCEKVSCSWKLIAA